MDPVLDIVRGGTPQRYLNKTIFTLFKYPASRKMEIAQDDASLFVDVDTSTSGDDDTSPSGDDDTSPSGDDDTSPSPYLEHKLIPLEPNAPTVGTPKTEGRGDTVEILPSYVTLSIPYYSPLRKPLNTLRAQDAPHLNAILLNGTTELEDTILNEDSGRGK